jgi:glycosyltransferase involved in cell wall biosynthesis
LGRWSKKKTLVLANTVKDCINVVDEGYLKHYDRSKLRIGFLGYLHPSRGRDTLVEFAKAYHNDVLIFIAGSNSDEGLEQIILESENIHYFGMLSRGDALALTRDLDANMMMYDPKIPVNKLADPNKFYESLMLGTPVILSNGMHLGENVEEAHIGFVVDYGNYESLFNKASTLKNPIIIKKYRKRCREYYIDHFDYDDDMNRYKTFYSEVFKT